MYLLVITMELLCNTLWEQKNLATFCWLEAFLFQRLKMHACIIEICIGTKICPCYGSFCIVCLIRRVFHKRFYCYIITYSLSAINMHIGDKNNVDIN